MIDSNSFQQNMPSVIMPAQLRAARGFLGWPRKQLGLASGVSPETIKNIEHGIYTPQDATNKGILQALSSHGVEFFNIARINAFGVILVVPRIENPSLANEATTAGGLS